MQEMTKTTNFSVFHHLKLHKRKVLQIEKFFSSVTVKNAPGDEKERWVMRWSFPIVADEENFLEKFNENYDRFNYFVNMKSVYVDVYDAKAASWTRRD